MTELEKKKKQLKAELELEKLKRKGFRAGKGCLNAGLIRMNEGISTLNIFGLHEPSVIIYRGS